MSKLEITLFGPPRFKLNGRVITNDIPSKSQALLAYLAVTHQTHSREALVGLLWGEMSEENARRNLRVALTKLRHPFDNYLIIQRRTLAFNRASDYWLDVDLFETSLRQPQATIQQIQTAVALYHGPFLAELPLRDAPAFEEWIRPCQERFRQLALGALFRLARHFTQQKQYPEGLDHLTHLLTLEPWLEEAHRQKMRLLVLTGQRRAALSQYEKCCQLLDEELGLPPSEATTALYHQILQDEIGEETATTAVFPPVPAWSPPFQAPATVRHFVGREALQAQITALLTTGTPPTIHALIGMGGIGKSTLCAQIAHALQTHFADGVLWANVATSDPMVILESWAHCYGYDFAQVSDLETMSAVFRGVLSNKRVLIILDDVTAISRVRPFLPGNGSVSVLLTTRDHEIANALPAHVWTLHPLRPHNGHKLLAQILGDERTATEPEAAHAICNLLHNLPLAVEIIAQRLKSRPRRRLSDMASRLRDETTRLSELAISDREVRASFALSYTALNTDLRHFALMGLFEGRPFTAGALSAVAGQDPYLLEERIYALITLSLAQEEETTHYRQHPLLADFARESLGEDLQAQSRLAAYYLEFARQHQRNYDALRPEWGNIMAAMQTAHRHQQWAMLMQFSDVLTDAWFTRGRYTEARQGYALATSAAAQLGATAEQAQLLHQWGKVHIEQKNYSAAHTILLQSQQCYQTTADARGLASVSATLARLALEQGDFERTRHHLATSRHWREALQDLPGMAEVSHIEARMNFFQGDFATAAQLGEQALALWESAADNPRGMIRTLNLLAVAAIEQKQPDGAAQYGQRSLSLAEQLQDKGEQAMAFDVLAHVHRLRGEFGQAQAAVEKSLALLETIGDLGSQANALFQLGRLHYHNGQYETALQVGQQSLQLCRTLNYRLLEVYILNCLGDSYYKLGQAAVARQTWSDALIIAQALNHPRAILDTERRLARDRDER